ncbi:MAG: DUF5317 domain-containing protein [Solirubrobacterales bacterium]|nr:DUF5317 domain-containing protein [Solirubrobacterales bacterium]
MLLGVGLVAVLVSVVLAGGRLGLVAAVRFRRTSAIVVALLAQVVVIEVVPGGRREVLEAVHVATYVVGGLFVLANLRLPGMAAMGLGGALNAIAITANGGVMPADPGALAAAGLATDHAEFLNSAAVRDPHLQPLGDVFATPPGLPFSNVFSVGDVLLLAGAAVFLHVLAQSRLAPRSRVDAELVDAGGATALLRVRVPARAGRDVALVVDGRRVPPLPGRAGLVVGFPVPAALPVEGLALEAAGRLLAVPAPRRRRLGA